MKTTKWLPNMDLNHDKQIQSLLCYRYTIRHRCGNQGNDFDEGVKPRMTEFSGDFILWGGPAKAGTPNAVRALNGRIY